MPDEMDLTGLSDDELAALRIKADESIQKLRDRKKAIQNEVDRRWRPPGAAAHVIGMGEKPPAVPGEEG